MKIKKIVLGIVICIIILLSFVAVKKIKEIFDDAIITKYDINGNEIYLWDGINSYKNYWKYNDKNQLLEYKTVGFNGIYLVTYEYENNNLIKTIHKRTEKLYNEDYNILYVYNENGLKIKEIHSKNGQTLYEYDKNSRLVKKTTPDNVITNYSYDENGNCTCEESSDGNIRKMEYDDEGRIIKRTHINDKPYGNQIYIWEYFDDDPEISEKCYIYDDYALTWRVYDKNGEYIETGIKFDDGDFVTKYKKVVKYKYWKNGQIKSKKVYNLGRQEEFIKK
jgi:YD repeat-containing protein